MISRKELGYVSGWANRVPYPGDNYAEEVLDKLDKAEQLFREIYQNNKYNITFSNNEEIELEIMAKNMSHLLGIDYKNLSQDMFSDIRHRVLDLNPTEPLNSYLLLQKIIENRDKVIEFDRGNSNIKLLNYYRVSVKSDIFSKLGNLADFNFGCINFNKDTFLKITGREYYNPNSTKFLYVPSDEPIAPYFLIGLLQTGGVKQNFINDEEESKLIENDAPYILETTLAPERVEDFFQNQEVIIPTQILKDTDKIFEKIPATPEDKIRLLKEYRSIIMNYGLEDNLNIYADYLAMLSQEGKNARKLSK